MVSSISLLINNLLFILNDQFLQIGEHHENILNIQIILDRNQVLRIKMLLKNPFGNADQTAKLIEHNKLILLLHLKQLRAHHIVIQPLKQIAQLSLCRFDKPSLLQKESDKRTVNILTSSLINIGLNKQVMKCTVMIGHKIVNAADMLAQIIEIVISKELGSLIRPV